MSIFSRLSSFVNELRGTRRCPTPEALVAYMAEKQGKKAEAYDALQWWVESRMWYEKDTGKGVKREWTPVREVLARDVPGKDIESDCEERSVVKKTVVNALKWGHADNLCVVWYDHKLKKYQAHAACVAWDAKGLILLDYYTKRWAPGTNMGEAAKAVASYFGQTVLWYYFAGDDGKPQSEFIMVMPCPKTNQTA